MFRRGLFGLPWMTAALVAALPLVLGLTNRVHHLSTAYQEVWRLATLPHAGTVVPTFRALTLDGDSVVVGAMADSTGRQVLFVFNAICGFCRASHPAWQGLADTLARLGVPVQVLGLSLDPADSTRAYVTTHRLRFPVLGFPEPKLARLYRATAVPVDRGAGPPGHGGVGQGGVEPAGRPRLTAVGGDEVARSVGG